MLLHSHPLIALALILVLTPPVAATATAAETMARRQSAGESVRSVAEVLALVRTDRTMTLRRDDGNTVTVHVAPQVKIFAQVSVGDFVVAEYGRAQALSVKKADPAAVRGDADAPATTAKPGAHRRRISADIMAIDDRRGFVTARGEHGTVVDLVVDDRKSLAALRIGDRVDIDYIEAVVTSLRPAQTKNRQKAAAGRAS